MKEIKLNDDLCPAGTILMLSKNKSVNGDARLTIRVNNEFVFIPRNVIEDFLKGDDTMISIIN
jgi:hypothetical protein